MIQFDRLSITIPGRTLVSDFSGTIGNAELTALIGRNGSGKSTLLRVLSGLSQDYDGNITIDSMPLRQLKPHKLARTVSYVSTSRTRIPNLLCRDAVALGRAPYTNWIGRMQQLDSNIVTDALNAVEMADYALRNMDTLSDGELQRIMIARALAQDTPVMLLDEPTSFLDIPARHKLVSLLAHIAHTRSKCIIFSTHELDVAARYVDSIALINTPHIILNDTTTMLSSGIIDHVFNISAG